MTKPLILFIAVCLCIVVFGCKKQNQAPIPNTRKQSEAISDFSKAAIGIDSLSAVLSNINLFRSIPRGADMLKTRRHVESRGFQWNQRAFEIMQRAGLSDVITFSSDSSVEFSIDFHNDRFNSANMSLVFQDSAAFSFYARLTKSLTSSFGKPTLQVSKVNPPYRADEILQALKLDNAQLESEWRLPKTAESVSASVFPVTGNSNSLSIFIEYKNLK